MQKHRAGYPTFLFGNLFLSQFKTPTIIMSENKDIPTKRPWHPVKIHAVEVAGWWNIQDGPNYEDTNILDEDKCPEAAANAAHIVHVVNTYEEREALLKEMGEAIVAAKDTIVNLIIDKENLQEHQLGILDKYPALIQLGSILKKYKSHTS